LDKRTAADPDARPAVARPVVDLELEQWPPRPQLENLLATFPRIARLTLPFSLAGFDADHLADGLAPLRWLAAIAPTHLTQLTDLNLIGDDLDGSAPLETRKAFRELTAAFPRLRATILPEHYRLAMPPLARAP
jgi:hypothetical protein